MIKQKIVIFIAGLGYHKLTESEMKQYSNNLEFYSRIKTIFLCNKSVSKIWYDIFKTLCFFSPNKTSSFVQQVHSIVNHYIDKDYDVFIIGHSYGGSIASIIAETFNDKKQRKNLHVITFGSIYVPKPDKTNNIDIKHFMRVNDVALKCNRLVYKKDTHVHWIKTHNQTNQFSLFGTNDQWISHNNYIHIMEKLLSKL
jgi:hypothetical protein